MSKEIETPNRQETAIPDIQKVMYLACDTPEKWGAILGLATYSSEESVTIGELKDQIVELQQDAEEIFTPSEDSLRKICNFSLAEAGLIDIEPQSVSRTTKIKLQKMPKLTFHQKAVRLVW